MKGNTSCIRTPFLWHKRSDYSIIIYPLVAVIAVLAFPVISFLLLFIFVTVAAMLIMF